MTKQEAQERMNELNWQRDRLREEILAVDARFEAVIAEGRTLLAEYPTLSLKTPNQVEFHQREALRNRLAGRKRPSREVFEEIGAPMLDEKE